MLEAAGIPQPTVVNSVQQSPIEGTSMLYSFDDAQAPERHDDAVLRGVLQPRHLPPGLVRGDQALHAVGHDGNCRRSRTTSGSCTTAAPTGPRRATWRKEMPEKLAELQRLFLIEAGKYGVLPLDDRKFERFNADLAGRPQLVRGDSQLLFGGMGRLTENSVVVIKNKSFSVTAEVEVPASGANGVIIAQGGAFGGWSLYAKDGAARFAYNFLGLETSTTKATTAIPAGTHQVRMEFAYDGGGLGKGGTVTLYYDGQPVGEGRVERTEPMIFSGDETTDIGRESGTPVSTDYDRTSSVFSGKVNWVQIDLGKDDHDHLISPDERLKLAMARQ